MAAGLTARERRALWGAIALLALVRLATLATYPVMDTTESRYAEIARQMLATGNWLTPQLSPGVPFWGKPPLSTWLAAGSMSVFGVNEFAARLPSLLLLLSCGALVFGLARRRAGRDTAVLATAFFASTLLVFVAAGAVMTDAALAFGTTLSMAGYWVAVEARPARARVAGYAFFVGLAIGLLAKGPIALVLVLLPIGAWTLWTRSWRAAWSGLPWVGGTLLAAALVVPWYLAAERATPGFLDYFIVGEHWRRFVEPGWTGDLYGAAHARPRGMIWPFWIAAALPWSVAAVAWLARAALVRRGALRTLVSDRWQAYLLLWTLAPMLFFTISANILATYVLPGTAAFALLLATLWEGAPADRRMLRAPARQVVAAGLLLSVAVVVLVVAAGPHFDTEWSNHALVRAYLAARGDARARLIYVARKPISADFYSRGRAIEVEDAARLQPYLADDVDDFVVVRARDLGRLPPDALSRLGPRGSYGAYRLFQEESR